MKNRKNSLESFESLFFSQHTHALAILLLLIIVIGNLYGKKEYSVFVYKDKSADFEVVLEKRQPLAGHRGDAIKGQRMKRSTLVLWGNKLIPLAPCLQYSYQLS